MSQVGSTCDQPAARRGEMASGFSFGYFSPTATQPPSTCTQCCLEGDPQRAATHGCALVQWLATPDDPAAPRGPMPKIPDCCDKGYRLWSFRAVSAAEPDVLVLSPAVLASRDDPIVTAAVEALRRSAFDAWQASRECEGLAGEVLQCYEQINLIFDISSEVASLSEEADIRRLLLDKLLGIYHADQVVYIDPVEAVAISVAPGGILSQGALPEGGNADASSASLAIGRDGASLPVEYGIALERLHASRQVIVLSRAEDQIQHHGHGTSLWGALSYGREHPAVVGVVRRRHPFEARDMLLLDSTLTFGGHILSNLNLVERLKHTSFEAVRALVNAIDQKDPYTCGHSERVGFLARAMGVHMGLATRQVQELEWGGLLHDIGKIGIPERVLNKPGPLSDSEFEIIQHHPARGFAVLKPVASLEGILDVVLHHHETPDGKGYPCGLEKDEIPLLARIVHVADTFDALTSTRSYRKAFTPERALDILRKESGIKFDPEVVEQFLAMWQELPQAFPEEYQQWFGPRPEESVCHNA